MMERFKDAPPKTLRESKVVMVKDYLKSKTTDLLSGRSEELLFPAADVVLQLITEDGSIISASPSQSLKSNFTVVSMEN